MFTYVLSYYIAVLNLGGLVPFLMNFLKCFLIWYFCVTFVRSPGMQLYTYAYAYLELVLLGYGILEIKEQCWG